MAGGIVGCFAGWGVGDAVHEEPVVGVGEFLGFVVRDLGEDYGGEG